MPEKKRVSLYVMPEIKAYLAAKSELTGKTINALIVDMIEADKKKARV